MNKLSAVEGKILEEIKKVFAIAQNLAEEGREEESKAVILNFKDQLEEKERFCSERISGLNSKMTKVSSREVGEEVMERVAFWSGLKKPLGNAAKWVGKKVVDQGKKVPGFFKNIGDDVSRMFTGKGGSRNPFRSPAMHPVKAASEAVDSILPGRVDAKAIEKILSSGSPKTLNILHYKLGIDIDTAEKLIKETSRLTSDKWSSSALALPLAGGAIGLGRGMTAEPREPQYGPVGPETFGAEPFNPQEHNWGPPFASPMSPYAWSPQDQFFSGPGAIPGTVQLSPQYRGSALEHINSRISILEG